jgi:arylsulfatase
MEGIRRFPFIIRWPGVVPETTTSNEIVQVTEIFTINLSIPFDRPMDGVDQTGFSMILSEQKPPRTDYFFCIKEKLRIVTESSILSGSPRSFSLMGKLELI